MPIKMVKEIIEEMVNAAMGEALTVKGYDRISVRKVAVKSLLDTGYRKRILHRITGGLLDSHLHQVEMMNEDFKKHCYTKFKELNKST